MSEDNPEQLKPEQIKPGEVITGGPLSSDNPLFDSDRAITQEDVTIETGKHYFDDDANTGLVVRIKDNPNPIVYSSWGGDIQRFTNCATAEEYWKFLDELSSSAYSTEQTPPPVVKKGVITTLRRKLGL